MNAQIENAICGGSLKRSSNIRLILITGLSAGALAGCGRSGPSPISTSNVYTNDFYVPGAGYYHAPFRAWFAYPYNYFDTQKKLFFFGGQWASLPNESITNISSPTAEAAAHVEAIRTDVTRGGFGSTYGGGHYFFHS